MTTQDGSEPASGLQARDAQSRVLRGAPRYLRGRAAGPYGVLAVVPEAEVSRDGRTVRPTALVALPPGAMRRYPIPSPARVRRSEPALDAEEPSPSDVAESVIVPGGAAPLEDPRVSAVFGPTQDSARGVTIPLAHLTVAGDGRPPRSTPFGSIAIAEGVVAVRLHGHGPAGGRRALLLGGMLSGIAWLLRRIRSNRAAARRRRGAAGRR